jgi:nucleotide-binding universal stress UspA family protein
MSVIVVGVDGSEPSREALRYAVRQARLEGANVRAVTAWNVPAVSYGTPWTAPLVNFPEVFEKDAKAISRGALEAVRDDTDGLQIEAVVREGHPAHVLLDEARNADLLVVGSRGLGGFSELLLGSVSHECAQHATCPVVIVRGPKDSE